MSPLSIYQDLSILDGVFNPAFEVMLDSQFERAAIDERSLYVESKRMTAERLFPPGTKVELSCRFKRRYGRVDFATTYLEIRDEEDEWFYLSPLLVDSVDDDGDVWCVSCDGTGKIEAIDPCCLFRLGERGADISGAVDDTRSNAGFFAGF